MTKTLPNLKLINFFRDFFFVSKETFLVVMGGDSCSKGHELESEHYIVDEHFSHTYLL